MQANTKNQLINLVLESFDKIILKNMGEKQRNRSITNLASHFHRLIMFHSSKDDALKLISCYRNSDVYSTMLRKYEVLKNDGFDKALEVN